MTRSSKQRMSHILRRRSTSSRGGVICLAFGHKDGQVEGRPALVLLEASVGRVLAKEPDRAGGKESRSVGAVVDELGDRDSGLDVVLLTGGARRLRQRSHHVLVLLRPVTLLRPVDRVRPRQRCRPASWPEEEDRVGQSVVGATAIRL